LCTNHPKFHILNDHQFHTISCFILQMRYNDQNQCVSLYELSKLTAHNKLVI